jgi:hypothetical protein
MGAARLAEVLAAPTAWPCLAELWIGNNSTRIGAEAVLAITVRYDHAAMSYPTPRRVALPPARRSALRRHRTPAARTHQPHTNAHPPHTHTGLAQLPLSRPAARMRRRRRRAQPTNSRLSPMLSRPHASPLTSHVCLASVVCSTGRLCASPPPRRSCRRAASGCRTRASAWTRQASSVCARRCCRSPRSACSPAATTTRNFTI